MFIDEVSQSTCQSTADCDVADPTFDPASEPPPESSSCPVPDHQDESCQPASKPSVVVGDFLKIPRLSEMGGQFQRMGAGTGEYYLKLNHSNNIR